MFREIRTSERISELDQQIAREEQRRLNEIFDKRIGTETEEDREFLKKYEERHKKDEFDPDERI